MPVKKYIIIFFLILAATVIILLSVERKPMYYSVKEAMLPQNELWTIEHADQMLDKAYQIGIPRIKDEQALLVLVKQAYQWDKNAMIQYGKILKNEMEIEPDKKESLGEFLIKYSYELVDRNNKPLETPAIFDLSYRDFMKVLADKGYPEPSVYIVSFDEAISHDSLIFYVKNIIQGGKRYYLMLANCILFPSSSGFHVNRSNELYKLTESIPKLSDKQREEAINNYSICATHGNQYCMVRLAEANFYGIGVNKNLEQAYIWTQLASETYKRYLERAKISNIDIDDKLIEQIINNFNQELALQIKQQLNNEGVKQANELVDQLRESIVTWNYEEWANKIDFVPPQP